LPWYYPRVVYTKRDSTKIPSLKKPLTNTIKIHEVMYCKVPARDTGEEGEYFVMTSLMGCHLICCHQSAIFDSPLYRNKKERGLARVERVMLTTKQKISSSNKNDRAMQP
jgi:hypothetical protein